jgi:hypothetical protein
MPGAGVVTGYGLNGRGSVPDRGTRIFGLLYNKYDERKSTSPGI